MTHRSPRFRRKEERSEKAAFQPELGPAALYLDGFECPRKGRPLGHVGEMRKSAYLGILALIASISFWIKASAKSGTTSQAISWMIFSES